MVRVGRGAILADRRARGIVGVEPVVAVSAQAAQLAEPERGVVPSMRCDVVGDGRWRDAAAFQAESAQWFDHELMTASALPASGAIPAMNFRTMRHARQTRVRAGRVPEFSKGTRLDNPGNSSLRP